MLRTSRRREELANKVVTDPHKRLPIFYARHRQAGRGGMAAVKLNNEQHYRGVFKCQQT